MNLDKLILDWRLFLAESKIPSKFTTIIDNKEFTITRNYHVQTPRNNSKIPRDAGMSKTKYIKLISLSINSMSEDGVYSITWTGNAKNNIISVTKKDYTFEIFGAIIKTTDNIDKLYKKAEKRINLGEISF